MSARYTIQTLHAVLNAAVFGGKLRTIPVSLRKLHPEVLGLCWGKRIAVTTGLDDETTTLVLLHEMVHQLQYERGQCMDHARFFELWRTKCHDLTGLAI